MFGWGFSTFPLNLIFAGDFATVIALAFWVWMIIDCAKRKFKNNIEKIIWLLVVVLGQTCGALIYLIAIFFINKKGFFKK